MKYLSNYDVQMRKLLCELGGMPFDTKDKSKRLALYYPGGSGGRADLALARATDDGDHDWEVNTESLGSYYLAGPMRGYAMSNFPAFLMAARILTARGFKIMSPAEKDIEAGFDPSKSLESQNFDLGAAFRWDFKAVIDCDGTILLPGWEKSSGAKAERLVAELCGRPVYLLDESYNLTRAPKQTYSFTWEDVRPAKKSGTPKKEIDFSELLENTD